MDEPVIPKPEAFAGSDPPQKQDRPPPALRRTSDGVPIVECPRSTIPLSSSPTEASTSENNPHKRGAVNQYIYDQLGDG